MKHQGLQTSLPIAINMAPNFKAQYWDRRIFFEHHPMSGKENQLETDPASVSFEVFTVVQLRIPYYWDKMLCHWVTRYCPHLQGSKYLGHCQDLITHSCSTTPQNRTLDLRLSLRGMELNDSRLRKATTCSSMLNDDG